MSALKKIVARVKQLRKKHPNAKYRSLQKQAGKEFKAGKLKAKRKPAKKRVLKAKKRVLHGATRRRKVQRKTKSAKVRTRTITVVKVRRIRVKAKPRKRGRVGSTSSKSMLPLILGVAAVGGLAYMLLKKPAVQYQQTGNVIRDNSANNVLSWATAAGLGISAISKLIDALNNSTNSQVTNAASNPANYVQALGLAGD